MIARRILISGHVQGVFYRNWTVEAARGLGLTGWVRNLSTGDVELLVMGDPEPVEQLIARLHEGPPAARVERVVVSETEAEPVKGFEKRPTA